MTAPHAGSRVPPLRAERRAAMLGRMSPDRGAHSLALAVVLLAGGCGETREDEWVALAPARVEDATTALAIGDDTVRRLVVRGGEVRLEVELARADWQAGSGGEWRVELGFQTQAGEGHTLSSGGESFVLARKARGEDLAEGAFLLHRGALVLRLPAGRTPLDALLACRLSAAAPERSGRVSNRRFSGDGFAVWPGAPVRRTCDVGPGRTLRFATTLDPLVLGSATPLAPAVFRVALDGETVFEHPVDPLRSSSAWHAVALPERRGAELAFSVSGTPGYAAFVDPRIGPAAVGRPGARPWGTSRPDVVVFLADTFRADNMALYGGALDLTPNLDRFARESLAFARAWSVGTFTLSAHASLFTGFYPRQAGIFDDKHALPDELVTLAESLAALGYRTGAITDAGIVSRGFALDQGFALFDEQWRTLPETLAAARAFLAADDGRPVFLFVQTYRVHRPYRVEPETRREHGERLGIEGEFEALEDELDALAHRAGHPHVKHAHNFPRELMGTDEARAAIAKLRAHYLGGVVDLDRGFELFRSDLAERGLLDSGFLVFTSDHGEAFGEHGQLYHKDDVYEEQTRIPLLIAGRGIRPGVVEHAASLIDLAPTLAELAGFPRDRRWLGRSLLALDEERRLFSFECSRNQASSTFATFEGGRKVLGLESPEALSAGRIFAAFELARDPGERDDVAAKQAWPRADFDRVRPTVERLLVPLVDERAASLDPDKRNELDDLGYGE